MIFKQSFRKLQKYYSNELCHHSFIKKIINWIHHIFQQTLLFASAGLWSSGFFNQLQPSNLRLRCLWPTSVVSGYLGLDVLPSGRHCWQARHAEPGPPCVAVHSQCSINNPPMWLFCVVTLHRRLGSAAIGRKSSRALSLLTFARRNPCKCRGHHSSHMLRLLAPTRTGLQLHQRSQEEGGSSDLPGAQHPIFQSILLFAFNCKIVNFNQYCNCFLVHRGPCSLFYI